MHCNGSTRTRRGEPPTLQAPVTRSRSNPPPDATERARFRRNLLQPYLFRYTKTFTESCFESNTAGRSTYFNSPQNAAIEPAERYDRPERRTRNLASFPTRISATPNPSHLPRSALPRIPFQYRRSHTGITEHRFEPHGRTTPDTEPPTHPNPSAKNPPSRSNTSPTYSGRSYRST